MKSHEYGKELCKEEWGDGRDSREIREGSRENLQNESYTAWEQKNKIYYKKYRHIHVLFHHKESQKHKTTSIPATHIIQVDCLKSVTGIFRYLKSFVWGHNTNGSWPGSCFCFFAYGISNYTGFGTSWLQDSKYVIYINPFPIHLSMYPSSICLPSIYSLNHSSAIQHPHPSNFHLSTIFHPFMRH